jgi:hypothetical protein
MNSIISLAVLLISAAPSFEAQTLDGRVVTGPLAVLTADRLTISAKGGNVSLGTQDVLALVPAQKPQPAARSASAVVELTDGSIIRGQQYLARGNQARIALVGGETVEVPLSAVRTVQLRQNSDEPNSEWSRLVKLKADSDLLIVRAEENLDYQKGVLQDVTEDVVRFELEGETLPVKRSKVFGFVYRHAKEPDLPPAVCRITDSAGSQWSVQSLALAGELRWTTPAGLKVAQPLGIVVEIDFSGGKLAYLGDMEPESVDWTPYFSVERPLPATQKFYAPRRDRGFESPALQLGGAVYAKGLALYCRTELVYRLPARFSRFQAVAGVDDAVRPNGKVRLMVRGDDKTLLETVILGSDPPRALNLDLKDVRRLTILVDFAGSLGAGDRLLLCNARVIK